MNEYNQVYQERKQKVMQLLTDSAQQLREDGQEQDAKNLEGFREKVEEDMFSIVTVGEFSAGKSTFLNALMHKAVLPSFSTETTATVNFLRHKDMAEPGQAGVVYYREPEPRKQVLTELNKDILAQVVSTRGNQEGQLTVAQTVDHVDLFLDSKFLKDGVMLVDSPGLNGIEEHHREITEDQIRKSHACIFLFGADRPGSRSDFEILRDLQNQVHNIFLVINKIDLIQASEGESPDMVAQKLQNDYKRLFPEATKIPHIWPISARDALTARDPGYRSANGKGDLSEAECRALEKRSGMEEFEDRLWRYLTQGERARDQLLSPVYGVRKILDAEQKRLASRVELLEQETGADELLQRSQALEQAIEANKRQRQENLSGLRKGVRSALRELNEAAGAKCENLRNRLRTELDEVGTIAQMEDEYSDLDGSLRRSLSGIARDLEKRLQEQLLEVVETQYEQYRDELESQMDDAGEGGFRLEMKPLTLSDLKAGVNLEQFEKETGSLSAQIEALKKEIEELDEKAIRAQDLEHDMEDKKKQIQQLRDSRDEYMRNFVIPEYSSHTEMVDDKEWRGGLFGWIGNLFLGKKKVQRAETFDNQSAIDKARKQQQDEKAGMDKEIEQLQQELNAMQAKRQAGYSPAGWDRRVERKEKKLEELRNEREQLDKKFEAELKKDAQDRLHRSRKEMNVQIEDSCDAFIGEVKDYLKKRSKTYEQMVQDLVDVNLNRELERQQKELDDLIRLIEEKGDQREKSLQQAREQIARLQDITGRAIELETELEENMEDHLEQEELEG